MKAAVRTKYGSQEVLSIQDIERPVPRDNEILVKVEACTVNRTDCAILLGLPFIMRFFTGLTKPRVAIPGTDFAGKVEATDKAVSKFKIGDRVWGFNDNGLASHAQYLCISEDAPIEHISDNISYEHAAASTEGAHYAYNFINKVTLHPEHKVMVYGASGAIGSATVQMLKSFGLYVTAVCDTKSLKQVKSLGADKIIDYTQQDFTADNERYDFIFDSVGKSRFKICKALLKPKGIYISSELGPNAENLFLSLVSPLSKGKSVKFPFPSNIKGSLRFIQNLIDHGQFTPLIDRTYSLDEIASAYEYVLSGQKIGNVVVLPWSDQ